jgi:hypothetical protein
VTGRILRQTLIAICLLLIANIASAGEESGSVGRFYATIGTGFDFNRGDYGERDANGRTLTTDTASIPFFAKLEWEPLTFRASIPVLYIDGSDQVTDGGVQNDGIADERQTFGIGDITTSLTYTYYPQQRSALPIVDLIVKVRVHTAMPSDLGSSGTDVTAGTELAKTFGLLTIFGGAGYRFRTAQNLDNIWLASAGGSVKIAKWISVGAAYDFRETSTSGSTNSHEVSPFVSLRVNQHVRVTPYAVIGLSDGAPDWGAGSTVSYEF